MIFQALKEKKQKFTYSKTAPQEKWHVSLVLLNFNVDL